MGQVLELNDASYAEAIKGGVTLVDFWAPWCGPCMMQGPIVEAVAEKAGDTAKIAKANVDEAREWATHLQIRGIPTVILFKDGKPVRQFVGVTSESDLLAAIEDARNGV